MQPQDVHVSGVRFAARAAGGVRASDRLGPGGTENKDGWDVDAIVCLRPQLGIRETFTGIVIRVK